MPNTAANILAFAHLLAGAAQANRPGVALPGLELKAERPGDGFKPTPHERELLISLNIRRVLPLHLDLARKLAVNSAALRRLHGVPLDEFLLDLLGFERVRQLLTRRFFKTYCHRAIQEESLWWAAEDLDRALQASVIKAGRIDSAEQLLREGERARQHLLRVGIPLRRSQ